MGSSLGQLGINFGSMVLYLVNFGLLFFILKHFLGKKVLALLDERRDRIANSLAAAEALQKEVAAEKLRLADEMQALRQRFTSENQALKQSLIAERAAAIADIEAYRAKSLAKAEQEAVQMRARIFNDLQTELRTAVGEMIFRILGKHASAAELEAVVKQAHK